MPKRGRQQLIDQTMFFVTSTTKEHQYYFNSPKILLSLLQIISEAMKRHDAILFGYVIMSNHIHLLVAVESGGPQLSKLMHNIKSISSHKLFKEEGGIWENRFDDLAIYTIDQFRTKLNYIHNNPVKAGIVIKPEQYQFSSAMDWIGGGGLIKVCTELL